MIVPITMPKIELIIEGLMTNIKVNPEFHVQEVSIAVNGAAGMSLLPVCIKQFIMRAREEN